MFISANQHARRFPIDRYPRYWPSCFASRLHCHPEAGLPGGETLGRRTSSMRRQLQILIVISTKFDHYNGVFAIYDIVVGLIEPVFVAHIPAIA